MKLIKSQVKYLKTMAHHLDPVIWIGQQGLTENVLKEINSALDSKELVKIRIRTGNRFEREIIIEEICRQTGAELIQSVGNMATVYLPNQETPVIKLPD